MDKLLLAAKLLITLLVLILFVQNIVLVEVQFLVWSGQLPLALLLLAIYLLGMVSGRALFALMRRLRTGRRRDEWR